MGTNTWQHRPLERSSPGIGGVAITPSDATVLDPPVRSLYVGGAGNVVVTGLDGNDVTFANVPAGGYVLIGCTKVKAATTATNITGIF